MPDLTPEQTQKIRELVHERKMIEAIATYRRFTGVGLGEAKDIITIMFHNDPLGSPPPIPQTTTNDPVLDKNIRELLSKNDKVGAVKLYCETRGVGLKAAEDLIDHIETSMQRTLRKVN